MLWVAYIGFIAGSWLSGRAIAGGIWHRDWRWTIIGTTMLFLSWLGMAVVLVKL